MTSPYGLKPTGFVRKPYEQILADIEARQRARISPNVDQSSSSPLGQDNAIIAREISMAWEELERINNAKDPDKAEDSDLESISKLTGTARDPARYSVVTVRCTLTTGTTIVSGAHFASVAGAPKNRWTPVENFTAPSDGAHDVLFRAEFVGPVGAPDDSITVIATPVIGWTAAINSVSAVTVGKNIDTNTELRTRREQSLQITGKATLKAIRAKLLKVAGVIDVWPLANKTFVTDGNGVPPLAVECIIYDGLTPAASNAEIGAALFDVIGANGPTAGSVAVNVTDEQGTVHEVRFSRVVVKPVYLDFFLTIGDGYVGAAAVKTAVVEQASKLYGVNDDVIALKIRSIPLSLQGVEDVTSLELGFSASPSGTANLAVSPREIAVFDVSRITVT